LSGSIVSPPVIKKYKFLGAGFTNHNRRKQVEVVNPVSQVKLIAAVNEF